MSRLTYNKIKEFELRKNILLLVLFLALSAVTAYLTYDYGLRVGRFQGVNRGYVYSNDLMGAILHPERNIDSLQACFSYWIAYNTNATYDIDSLETYIISTYDSQTKKRCNDCHTTNNTQGIK